MTRSSAFPPAAVRRMFAVRSCGHGKRGLRDGRTLHEQAYTQLEALCDVTIAPEVGPEVVTGSTRMKSGTAQKMVLNMLTTCAMVKLGKVYGNLMVDLRASNNKLARPRRCASCIHATGADAGRGAARRWRQADGHVKLAILMIKTGMDAAGGRGSRLKRCDGPARVRPSKRQEGRTN